jgi:hypothetical protein
MSLLIRPRRKWPRRPKSALYILREMRRLALRPNDHAKNCGGSLRLPPKQIAAFSS